MFTWLWKVLPDQYKWSVAGKKVAYTAAKFGIGWAAGTKIGRTVSPENWQTVEAVSGALIAGGITYIHDWARLKWPNQKWL